MMVSVIVPGYNVRHTIAACLEALLNQSVPRQEYEVIYVDDASTDGSVDIVRRYPEVRLFTLATNCGQATARNLGLREARGEIVLFTDADCVPAPDWIAAMLRPFADPHVAGAKGVYRTTQRSLVPRFAQLEYESRYDLMRRQKYIDFVDTYSAGYRREVLLRHGGFDPRFRIDEDQELSFRLAAAGHKMVFNPDAVVYHQHPATLWRYLKRKFDIGYWKAFVLDRHPRKAVHDSHTPQGLKLQLALAFLICFNVVGALFYRPLWTVAGGMAALFLATALPLTIKAARRDLLLGFITPFMVWLRALALGSGLAVGLWHVWRRRGDPPCKSQVCER